MQHDGYKNFPHGNESKHACGQAQISRGPVENSSLLQHHETDDEYSERSTMAQKTSMGNATSGDVLSPIRQNRRQRLVGSDLRAWRRFSTDYGQTQITRRSGTVYEGRRDTHRDTQ
jgi:hypothetical protein